MAKGSTSKPPAKKKKKKKTRVRPESLTLSVP